MPSIISVFPNVFNKFSTTGERIRNSIYNMTQRSHLICDFRTKTRQDFTPSKHEVVWPSTHNVT